MAEALDFLGKLVMRSLRDPAIEFVDMLDAGRWKAPELSELQRKFRNMDPDSRKLVRRVIREAVDHSVHDFLFKLYENCEQGKLNIERKGIKIHSLSDGFHGELFTEDGWQARFSKYGEGEGR